MYEPFIGGITLFAGNFEPRGWAFCNGQLLSIAQNSALFSILGTTYGGDGTVTFALPDLRGRAPIHFGQGRGLTERRQGEAFGTESVTLTAAQLPPHSHSMDVSLPLETTPTPRPDVIVAYNAATPPMARAAPTSIVGGGQPVAISQPSLAINYIIALQGIYPSRS